jgi:hypothetical protein
LSGRAARGASDEVLYELDFDIGIFGGEIIAECVYGKEPCLFILRPFDRDQSVEAGTFGRINRHLFSSLVKGNGFLTF